MYTCACCAYLCKRVVLTHVCDGAPVKLSFLHMLGPSRLGFRTSSRCERCSVLVSLMILKVILLEGSAVKFWWCAADFLLVAW